MTTLEKFERALAKFVNVEPCTHLCHELLLSGIWFESIILVPPEHEGFPYVGIRWYDNTASMYREYFPRSFKEARDHANMIIERGMSVAQILLSDDSDKTDIEDVSMVPQSFSYDEEPSAEEAYAALEAAGEVIDVNPVCV